MFLLLIDQGVAIILQHNIPLTNTIKEEELFIY